MTSSSVRIPKSWAAPWFETDASRAERISILPDQFSDFPFPVFAEEWGFVGSMVLLGLYAFLVIWSRRIASLARVTPSFDIDNTCAQAWAQWRDIAGAPWAVVLGGRRFIGLIALLIYSVIYPELVALEIIP